MTDDESKRIILSRRARFIAAALASAGLAANPACGGDVEESDKVAAGGAGGAGSGGGGSGGGGSGGTAQDGGRDAPQVCLSPPGGFGGAGAVGGVAGAPFDARAEPMPCLEAPLDAGPQPCLSQTIDAQADPQPCLTPFAPDSDAEPQPCLVPPK